MRSWQKVWRDGLAPSLSTEALEALLRGVVDDDPALVQGATCSPPPLPCVHDWAPEAACALGYCGWQGDHLESVADVEEYFARMCFETDQRLGEPGAIRWFLNWFDETPRAEMRRQLAGEVALSLAARAAGELEIPQ